MFDKAKNSLFEFYRFPEEIRASLYTTNLIERSNKGLKHLPKVKEQFPNETSLDRFVCSYYSEANRTYADRAQRGFLSVSAELLKMFVSDPTEQTMINGISHDIHPVTLTRPGKDLYINLDGIEDMIMSETVVFETVPLGETVMRLKARL